MRLGNFEVRFNPPGRKNIWAKILGGSALAFFISGMTQTHWMASYRLDDLVPQENQLVRYGPVYMSHHRTRSGPEVVFYNQHGETLLAEKNFSVPLNDVLGMVDRYSGQPIAYLWVYNKNPARRVWEVDLDGERILTLQRATSEYVLYNSSGYGSLLLSATLAAWFVVSILEVNRINRNN